MQSDGLISISCPTAHAGQEQILSDTARFKAVRCGRRFGKTTLGIIATIREVCRGDRNWAQRWGPRIGWFTPLHKFTSPVFHDLVDRLGPLVQGHNASDMTILLPRGGRIECWSLHNNPDAGRSRYYDLAIVDEAGLIPGLKRWFDSSLRQTLVDRKGRMLMLGTPHAISPEFNEFYDEAGERQDWRSFPATTFDNPHLPREELDEIKRSKDNMSDWLWNQEYMGIPADTAAGIFGREMIRQYIADICRQPSWRGRIGVETEDEWQISTIIQRRDSKRIFAFDDPRSPWMVWGEPDDERQGDIAIGIDLSAGVGSSNTVMSVGTCADRQKFAEFASPGVTPEEAAKIACMAGYYFGGREKPAWIWFEANGGGGEQFARELMRLKYPRIRSRGNERWSNSGGDSTKIGWYSNPTAKESLILGYSAELTGRRFINPSEKSIRECLTYVYRKGRVASISQASDGYEELAKAPHGDRVIADALLVDVMRWSTGLSTPTPIEYPKNSVGSRIQEELKKAMTRSKW